MQIGSTAALGGGIVGFHIRFHAFFMAKNLELTNPARGLIAGNLLTGPINMDAFSAKEKRMRAKSRIYLPSEEREEYVAYARRRGCTLVTVGQKNRYVDEFVRFCSSHSGHSDVKDIDTMDFLNYGKWLESSCRTYATGQAKIGRAIQWFNWLAETGRIKKNPARGLIAGRLIPSSPAPGRPPVVRSKAPLRT